MALSNWDTLAFDTDGKACNGVLFGFDHQVLEIYKNWVYVSDHKMWVKDRDFVDPVIAEIFSGNCRIASFNIFSTRGPQESIFVYVESIRHKGHKTETKRMAGIGCCGYDDPTDKIIKTLNIKKKDYKEIFYSTVCPEKGKEKYIEITCIRNADSGDTRKVFNVPFSEEFESQWVGVQKSTYSKFIKWLRSLEKEDKEFMDWIDSFEKPQRFNQGDAYFARRCNTDIPSSEIGKTTEPILASLISLIKKLPAKKAEKKERVNS